MRSRCDCKCAYNLKSNVHYYFPKEKTVASKILPASRFIAYVPHIYQASRQIDGLAYAKWALKNMNTLIDDLMKR